MDAKWTRDGFHILDKEHHSTSMSNICMTDTFSDLTLISKEGTSYPAHRSLLAARSDYFSALLYGGLKESGENVVTLMCSDKVLKPILHFLYSGKIHLQGSTVDFLMDLLDVARLMCIDNLREALENLILEEIIKKPQVCFDQTKNIVNILNVAIGKEFKDLIKFARSYLEENIDDVLMSSDHLQSLSASSFKLLISGNDLDVPEIEIFQGVMNWISSKEITTSEEQKAVLSEVRLDQMTTKQLIRDVHPSGLFLENELFSAISAQENVVKKGNSRKVLLNQNLCLSSLGAKVIDAEESELSDLDVVINGKTNCEDYDDKKGYVMTDIGERLEVELPSRQKINKINILLHDKDCVLRKDQNGRVVKEIQKDYSYRVETSLDGVKWEMIANFSNYNCKSWQTIYFLDRRVKFIGIIGTKVTTKRACPYSVATKMDESLTNGLTPPNYIHVVAIEAFLDTNTEKEDRKNSGMKKILEV